MLAIPSYPLEPSSLIGTNLTLGCGLSTIAAHLRRPPIDSDPTPGRRQVQPLRPLPTGRTTEVAPAIRVGLAPQGALTGDSLVTGTGQTAGVMTSMAFQGTTVAIAAALARLRVARMGLA
jgi:hypothetical protein